MDWQKDPAPAVAGIGEADASASAARFPDNAIGVPNSRWPCGQPFTSRHGTRNFRRKKAAKVF
jgi:hypothetical protein